MAVLISPVAEHAPSGVPSLRPASRAERRLYLAATLVVACGLWLPLRPGSVDFFVVQAVLWGFATGLFSESRRLAWERLYGKTGGDPPHWKQPMPAWAFEASAWVQVGVYVPLTVAMLAKCFGSLDAFHLAHGAYLHELPGDDLWPEQLIFSSLFGFMVRDMVIHFRRPDPLLTVHHILVCFLMVAVSFWQVKGVRLLALLTPVVELGSCAYCFWCVRQWKALYVSMMTFSNVAWVLVACATTFLHDFSPLQLLLCSVGISMASGRQLFLASELRSEASAVSKQL